MFRMAVVISASVGARLLLALLVLLAGCAGEQSAGVVVKLVVDPSRNTEAQLLSIADTIELVFDVPEGFTGLARGAEHFGAFAVKDVDNDSMPELVLSKDLTGFTALPQIRVQAGSDPGATFDIMARGLVGPEVVALGKKVEAVSFESGQEPTTSVPLNLLNAYLPPRVLHSIPGDQQTVPRALGALLLEFSKKMAPWAEGALRLSYEGIGDASAAVPGRLDRAEKNVDNLGGFPEVRTVAIFTIDATCALNPGTYRIDVTSAATDIGGTPLDQDALRQGDNGLSATFTIAGEPATGPCAGIAGIETRCRDDQDCQSTGSGAGEGGGAFVCAKPTNGTGGRCVPAHDSCDKVSCPGGYVCDPGDDALLGADTTGAFDGIEAASYVQQAASCVHSCLESGTCAPGTGCDPETGLCIPIEEPYPNCPLHERPPNTSRVVRAFLTQRTPGEVGDQILFDPDQVKSLVTSCGPGQPQFAYWAGPATVGARAAKGTLLMLAEDVEYYEATLEGAPGLWTITNHPEGDPVAGRCGNLPQGLGISCFTDSVDEITVLVPTASSGGG